MRKEEAWFRRNEEAEALERSGDLDGARRLYEANAAENCTLVYTYDRLAALHRRANRHPEELDMLERATALAQKQGHAARLVQLAERRDQAKIDADRQLQEIAQRRAQRPARRSSADVARKDSKGCLGVLLVGIGLAALLLP